ncbi:glutamate synthase large subunit [Clostridium sp. CMCC3677]|uniref:glutamate synthase large subunit n=1 Tax=Clostridium sp. CMCC3677 TaxID=2949963 RepID=UPI0013F1428C|nr:glutamate synthase large subunit [Clostridium sp. CMCC3677]NFG60446.1 glutamate synthase large subunit [Clostridium botulinum]NFQ09911.1 glutamate synthase large subunit [Clostridium botulinum]
MEKFIPKKQGLYNPCFEHDACGIGTIVNIDGEKSHDILSDCLTILEKLKHRGGTGADENTGDGAGVLLNIPHKFFTEELKSKGIVLGNEGDYAVGMIFLPQEEKARKEAESLIEDICKEEGLEVIGWRDVPSNPSILGKASLEAMPVIKQIFVKRVGTKKGIAFERKLYIVRRNIEKRATWISKFLNEIFYMASFSSKTIVYKGMLLSTQLREFYKDLEDERVETSLALVHSRYSTNTFPSWERAHPNRFMIHNGEINTLRGNVNKVYSRETNVKSRALGKDLIRVLPIINKEGSDSAILDNNLEFLYMNGMDLTRAVMMAIPEPWQKSKTMSKEKKAFYEYNATLMEPWDGPAAIVFTDGEKVGAVLDRNGLRPSRYYITKDRRLILSSEVGALDIPSEIIEKKDRLRPGRMLIVDTIKKEVIDDEELKHTYATEHPYGEWLEEKLVTLDKINDRKTLKIEYDKDTRKRLEKTFGYTYEEVKTTILHMAENGAEPLAAMGIDVPIAPLSKEAQPLFNYFKQLFAQVTNPPIDAIREEIVTASNIYLGPEGNILEDKSSNCELLKLESPIINNEELSKIKALNKGEIKTKVIDIVFDKGSSLEDAIDEMFDKAQEAYEKGYTLLVLSDRNVCSTKVPIPSLLAVSALHQYLVKKGTRTSVGLILESGEPREIHHFATLIGFGASAVNPYMAYESLRELIEEGLLEIEYDKAVYNYNKAVVKGIIKILSKMGISTIQSYQGAQIFEAVGIGKKVIDRYFTNTVSRIGGIGLEEIQREAEINHEKGFKDKTYAADFQLDSPGYEKLRSGEEKEEHLYNPNTIHKLQKATKTGDYELFKEYASLINDEEAEITLRGLLEFNYNSSEIPLDEVESVSEIVKRFKTGAMSYGSISKEAHEALAIAMNRVGGKSNTGEGGEDSERWIVDKNGDSRRSSIKQIASGRFGVTSEYLVNADELQIKLAQGAKPGEGGQLPATKVYPWVAKTRHSTTGVGLISPPPHHDIYSIEDLAQLIYDLKNANMDARISVKLVSECGVGTVAAGVAKGGADVILISGYDGGTGASPKNSIKNAGLPWELGLAEAHQTLLLNELRDRVTVEVDGKLMTGRDVAIAALLGAEEFGFATAPLVSLGCVMMRVCNLDTCPVGIATQNEELRKRFKGKPEYVVNFMYFIAQELREIMAKLGFRKIDEMIGRVDRLKQKENIHGWKAKNIDLSSILYTPDKFKGKVIKFDEANKSDHKLNEVIDKTMFVKKCKDAINGNGNIRFEVDITNTDRTLGTILGSEITKVNGNKGLPEDGIVIKCNGGAGQSFGSFIPKGLTFEVEGDANDYFGKGLSGGKLIVYPPKKATFIAEENILIGNVALYGATSGKVFINGIAGERFCVRNSGATAVVEGVGAHGCEYMTGGKVVVLGKTGINFAAGMSGGVAYLYKEDDNFKININEEMILLEELSLEDEEDLKDLLEEHVEVTGSSKGNKILSNFENDKSNFIKVIPKDYKKVLKAVEKYKNLGFKEEEALIKTFQEIKGR